MKNSSNEYGIWSKARRRHLVWFVFSAFLSAFGVFDLIYFFYEFQPIFFWANDILLISSSAGLFSVVLVSVAFTSDEYDPEWIQIQATSRNIFGLIIKPLGIGKIVQWARGKSIQPVWLSAINIIQLIFLVGIASYFLGIRYNRPEDSAVTVFIVVTAAILIVGYVILEHLLWAQEVRNQGISKKVMRNVDIKTHHLSRLHSLRSKPPELSKGSVRGISKTDFISMLDKVILSDEFKTGKDD